MENFKEQTKIEDKIKLLKENMNNFEQWGNPQYKGFIEHCLKHYPDISEKQMKSIEINFYQLQRFLNKTADETNKFKYDYDKNRAVAFAHKLLEGWEDEDSWVYDDDGDDYDEYEKKIKKLEKKVYKVCKDNDDKYKINKKELSYGEYKVEPEEFSKIYIDYPSFETITKVFNTYLFYYYDNVITGFLSLVETDKHNRYIVGEICDMIQEEGNNYLGKADNIDKKDFDKNIDYLITEYLAYGINRY